MIYITFIRIPFMENKKLPLLSQSLSNKRTLQSLFNENNNLKRELHTLNRKVDTYYQKTKLNILANSRTTKAKKYTEEDVLEKELTNGKNYTKILEGEKKALEEKLEKLKSSQVESLLIEKKQLIKDIQSQNKQNSKQVLKNSRILAKSPRNFEKQYNELLEAVNHLKRRNDEKSQKIEQNQKRNQDIVQELEEISYQLSESEPTEKEKKNQEQLQKVYKQIKHKRDVLASSIKSNNQRYQQEYNQKSKQLQNIKNQADKLNEKVKQLESQLQEIQNISQSAINISQ